MPPRMSPPSIPRCLGRLPHPVHQLVASLEERSPAIAAHGRRVGAAALQLAAFAHRFDQAGLEQIFLAGYLHDIGKLGVPLSILDKPDALTQDEWEIVRLAPVHGASLLRPLLAPGAPLVDAVRGEHERWDGGGYPDGLVGEEIPEVARIVLIADTLDALRLHTAYRAACGLDDALRVLRAGAGRQFDPAWVDRAVKLWGSGSSCSGPAPTAVPRGHSNHNLCLPEDGPTSRGRAA